MTKRSTHYPLPETMTTGVTLILRCWKVIQGQDAEGSFRAGGLKTYGSVQNAV